MLGCWSFTTDATDGTDGLFFEPHRPGLPAICAETPPNPIPFEAFRSFRQSPTGVSSLVLTPDGPNGTDGGACAPPFPEAGWGHRRGFAGTRDIWFSGRAAITDNFFCAFETSRLSFESKCPFHRPRHCGRLCSGTGAWWSHRVLEPDAVGRGSFHPAPPAASSGCRDAGLGLLFTRPSCGCHAGFSSRGLVSRNPFSNGII